VVKSEKKSWGVLVMDYVRDEIRLLSVLCPSRILIPLPRKHGLPLGVDEGLPIEAISFAGTE
jgi:hypothetical protein